MTGEWIVKPCTCCGSEIEDEDDGRPWICLGCYDQRKGQAFDQIRRLLQVKADDPIDLVPAVSDHLATLERVREAAERVDRDYTEGRGMRDSMDALRTALAAVTKEAGQ
jgi:hypothetical protein